MANLLTGDYEAAVQIATRQIDGLLGTLHQNAAIQSAPLKLLHSTNLRIGDAPQRRPEVDVLTDWLVQYQKARPGRGLRDIRAQLTAAAPPGAAKMLHDAFAGLDDNPVFEIPPDVIRGAGKVQVSTVRVTVPNSSSSEIAVHARVRAHYYPDQGTTDLPSPIHGDLLATFDVRKVQAGSATRLLIKPSAQDAKIQFTGVAGAGLDASEASRIAAEIRRALRNMMMPPVDLPADFPFSDFKGLGGGQVLALPFQLSGAAPPASGVQTLNHAFVGSSGFAIGISKEHVTSLIDIEAIRQAILDRDVTFRIDVFIGSVSVTYGLRFSQGPALTFKSGGIEISGRVEVETGTSWAPNGFVRFKQLVTLVLDVPSQTVRLERVGEPDVDESWFIPHGRAVDIVKSEIDKALTANRPQIRRVFNDGRNALVRGFRTFDSTATVTYTDAEVTPDGIIVRGDIGSAGRRPPVVHIAETHQGQAFTAFQSWIPAGRIDRLIWSWVEYSGPHGSIFSGTEKSLTEQHRFILPKPAGVTNLSQICLRIEGTQILPNGQEISIVGGTTCRRPAFEFAMEAPSWFGPVTIPIWQPDLDPARTLREGIAGHVSVQSNTPAQQPLSRSALIYFADWRADKPLEALHLALDRVRNRSALMVIVVLPAGAFDQSRREFEARTSSPGERGGPPIHFTEDDEAGWTGMFGVTKTPSVYLVNAKREFVWKHEGDLDPAALAEVINKHATTTRPSQAGALNLAVSPGESMRDAMFEDDSGNQFALHRLQGRDALLNFWQSWSAPCLAELSRLQRLHQSGGEKPFIVSFHGGKSGAPIEEIRKRLGLTFPLVQDSHQRIARQYGVLCWPTTILVDRDGRVQDVQFGKEHPHGAAAGSEPSNQAQTSA